MPEIKVKKKCCKSNPRCKKCPVVMHRLTMLGHAKKVDSRLYAVTSKPPKKVAKSVRAR
ncbi:hypothetical protein [Calidifontibacter terrae]